jgi:hypothetical protein
MQFKKWLEATISKKNSGSNWNKSSEDFFGQRDKIQKKDISKILSDRNIIPANMKLKKLTQGSLATIYEHPTNANLLIKITPHKEDARNLWRGQKVKSECIVKLYGEPIELSPEMPRVYVMIVDKVVGVPMVYSTVEFIGLIGDKGRSRNKENASVEILYPSAYRESILEGHNKNTEVEYEKLSNLFKALYHLERIGIDMVDFSDNILDTGEAYVIVDLGF